MWRKSLKFMRRRSLKLMWRRNLKFMRRRNLKRKKSFWYKNPYTSPPL
jgi:hypothetical protein